MGPNGKLVGIDGPFNCGYVHPDTLRSFGWKAGDIVGVTLGYSQKLQGKSQGEGGVPGGPEFPLLRLLESSDVMTGHLMVSESFCRRSHFRFLFPVK